MDQFKEIPLLERLRNFEKDVLVNCWLLYAVNYYYARAYERLCCVL